VTKAPVRLHDLFRFYKELPHQTAAITELEQALLKADPTLLNREQPWFRTWSQAGKQPEAAWLEPAIKIIKEFEGLRLYAYQDAVGVWTIGYGTTRYPGTNGGPVRRGDTISNEQAEEFLRDQVLSLYAPGVLHLLPMAKDWSPNRIAALVSFAYNVGLSALERSTLRSRLLAGENPITVVSEELPRWNRGDNTVLPGLTRRRAAEVELFAGKPLQQQTPAPAKLTPASPFNARLTPHIRLGEFALDREERRFHHQHQVDTAFELATFMEQARKQFGNKPVVITSGYRPAAINRSVGGASGSEHLYNAPGVGAVDWFIQGVSIHDVQNWCDRNWPYSLGYGAPKGFVHLGIRAGRPRVRWVY
jgi:GH24 family phage-related lysozyme (muramidase)